MNFDIVTTLLSIPAILIALTVHEYAHGYAAYRLGDPTARSLGRLSLNPMRHLDPIGAICMLFFHFGWAKPVPINARYFKKPRRDMAITALCGPISNFLLAFLGAFLYVGLFVLLQYLPFDIAISSFSYRLLEYTLRFLYYFHFINLAFGIFNCLPIPPLDGSRFFFLLLPPKAYFRVMRYEQYISLILMLLLFTGAFTGILSTAAEWLSDNIINFVGNIFQYFMR